MGGEIKLYKKEKRQHENVERVLVFEPTDNDIDHIVEYIKKLSTYDVYVFGTGAQTKSKYRNLSTEGIEILWYQRLQHSFWMSILTRIIPASYCGLIKIKNLEQLERVVSELTVMSSVEIYVTANIELKELKEPTPSSQLEKTFMDDPSFFQIVVDKDNFESANGMLCIIRHGKNCPTVLKEIIDNFGELGYLGFGK